MSDASYRICGAEMQFVELDLPPGQAAVGEAGSLFFLQPGISLETVFGDGSKPAAGMLEKMDTLSNGIGTGPYKLVEFNPNDSLVYEAFTDHWNPAAPSLAKLPIKMQPDPATRVTSVQTGKTIGTKIDAAALAKAKDITKDPNATVASLPAEAQTQLQTQIKPLCDTFTTLTKGQDVTAPTTCPKS